MNLPNWANQKPRAFQIGGVAEPTLDDHTRFTPLTRVFSYVDYLKSIHIYYITLHIKFYTYYNPILHQQGANTFNFG